MCTQDINAPEHLLIHCNDIDCCMTFVVNTIVMANDTEVILNALQKERDDLHEKIMQVDRIIKRVKSLEYSTNIVNQPTAQISTEQSKPAIEQPINLFPKSADIKVQILRIFDIRQKASKMHEIQTDYSNLSNTKFNIREHLRTMFGSGLLRIIKEKDKARGFFYAKPEWIVNDVLADDYKPEGWDLIYKQENLIYE
jgi:uncharacterized protein YoxC